MKEKHLNSKKIQNAVSESVSNINGRARTLLEYLSDAIKFKDSNRMLCYAFYNLFSLCSIGRGACPFCNYYTPISDISEDGCRRCPYGKLHKMCCLQDSDYVTLINSQEDCLGTILNELGNCGKISKDVSNFVPILSGYVSMIGGLLSTECTTARDVLLFKAELMRLCAECSRLLAKEAFDNDAYKRFAKKLSSYRNAIDIYCEI